MDLICTNVEKIRAIFFFSVRAVLWVWPLGTGTSCVPGSSGHAFGTSALSYMQTLPTQCYRAATRAERCCPADSGSGAIFRAEQFARAILGQNNLAEQFARAILGQNNLQSNINFFKLTEQFAR